MPKHFYLGLRHLTITLIILKTYNPDKEKLATLSTFLLIPLSGLATDIFLPSFPEMQRTFKVSAEAIQLTLSCFFISYGLGMFFVGALVDTIGRYKPIIYSLILFALSSFLLATTRNINLVYAMRIVQGVTTAFIVVGKRAFLVDVFKGEKLHKYMSMLSIIWSIAPISAPFVGGYLQKTWGWQSNFYLLGIYALVALVWELLFSGESIPTKKTFSFAFFKQAYQTIFKEADYVAGLLILGLTYAMIMVFAMSAPFIVENQFHLSAVATGYCALLSGVAMMAGGFIGKATVKKRIDTKVIVGYACIVIIALCMYYSAGYLHNLATLMVFVFLIHMLGGFIYNAYLTYNLTRFPQNAGVASGVSSGASSLLTAIFSYLMISAYQIDGQQPLAINYGIFALTGLFLLFTVFKLLKTSVYRH